MSNYEDGDRVEMTESTPAQVDKQKMSQGLNKTNLRKYICPKATDTELYMFAVFCHQHQLNPYLRQAHLIKPGDRANAYFVVAKDEILKRAKQDPKWKGFKAGIIAENKESGDIRYGEGAFFNKEKEVLMGGWAEVFIEGEHPVRSEVNFAEYVKEYWKDGKLVDSIWQQKPGTMIRKVALSSALRESFPNYLADLYDASEMGVDEEQLPKGEIKAPPDNGGEPEKASSEPKPEPEEVTSEPESQPEEAAPKETEIIGAGIVMKLSTSPGVKAARIAAESKHIYITVKKETGASTEEEVRELIGNMVNLENLESLKDALATDAQRQEIHNQYFAIYGIRLLNIDPEGKGTPEGE